MQKEEILKGVQDIFIDVLEDDDIFCRKGKISIMQCHEKMLNFKKKPHLLKPAF